MPPDTPRDPTLVWHLRAAFGWMELGAPEEAWFELEEIAPEHRHREEIVVLRMEVLQKLEHWDAGSFLGRGALRHYPDNGALYLLTAYCVRRHESLEAARTLLREGAHVLCNDAIWNFNLACYECQLGDLEAARAWLVKAFRLDPKRRVQALEDANLEPLWTAL